MTPLERKYEPCLWDKARGAKGRGVRGRGTEHFGKSDESRRSIQREIDRVRRRLMAVEACSEKGGLCEGEGESGERRRMRECRGSWRRPRGAGAGERKTRNQKHPSSHTLREKTRGVWERGAPWIRGLRRAAPPAAVL